MRPISTILNTDTYSLSSGIHYFLCSNSLVAQRLKRLPAMWETQVQSPGREDPWRRKWHPTPVLLPGKFHGRIFPNQGSDQRLRDWQADSLPLEPPGKPHSESEVTQLCLTLCDPMDCSLPGSSIHGIFQARVLEWIAISCSRGSS